MQPGARLHHRGLFAARSRCVCRRRRKSPASRCAGRRAPADVRHHWRAPLSNIQLLHKAPSGAIISASSCSEDRPSPPRLPRILARKAPDPRSLRLRLRSTSRLPALAMTDAVPDSLLANAIRALAMDAVEAAKSGHPGMPMGMAEIAVALWNRHLVHNPANPHWANRDRFVISNGHGSMLLYALLHLTGYDLPMEELKRFRQLHSKTPGHPEFGLTPGVETTTGPLGQGLANAVGMALAERLLAAQFNRPGHAIVDHRTYCFVGDGCLMEGISHEAASLAGTLGLGQADGALRRQRHLDRRRNEGLVHRRHARPLPGLRLERDPARRRARRRSRRPRDPRRAPRHRSAHAHLLQDDHRQRLAAQAGDGRGARRGAGRKGSRG